MSRSTSILIVEDERPIREVVRRYLELDGYTVYEAEDGLAALELLAHKHVDLLVLDIMLPGLDGLGVVRRLRHSPEYAAHHNQALPIIFLTARKGEDDRLQGFEAGGDDYIVKPFSARELAARVKAVLRRSTPLSTDETLQLGALIISPTSREVSLNGQAITLTAKEFDLLWFLARHPRQVFSRAQLLDNVWGYEFYGDESTVTVHMRRLREKVERDPSKPTYIQTVWGVGYKFDIPEE